MKTGKGSDGQEYRRDRDQEGATDELSREAEKELEWPFMPIRLDERYTIAVRKAHVFPGGSHSATVERARYKHFEELGDYDNAVRLALGTAIAEEE